MNEMIIETKQNSFLRTNNLFVMELAQFTGVLRKL